MNRSEANKRLKDAETFFKENKFSLPPWASWTLRDWNTKTAVCHDEIRECCLGWDITDFGN